MGVFEFVIVITLVAGSIHLGKMWIRRNASANRGRTRALEHEVEELRERVKTLERIVTDQKYNLNREIDQLDDR